LIAKTRPSAQGAANCPRASVLGPFYTNAQGSDAQGAGLTARRTKVHGAQDAIRA